MTGLATTDGAPLRAALAAELAGLSERSLAARVERLSAVYRSGEVPTAPVLDAPMAAAAYAAYRMPATYGAVVAALRAARAALPSFAPTTVLDVGAGTGAASWAVTDVHAPEHLVLLEQSPEAVQLGRALARHSGAPALRSADWRVARLSGAAPLPAADLVVAAYLLGELAEPLQAALVASAAASAAVVALVEPGTPAGSARIVRARDQLLALGLRIAAPCPHDGTCPLAAGRDWCHFAARVPRSGLHRRLKDGRLAHEDEKLSYVVASRPEPTARPAARVLRHPQQRKGLVTLELCAGPDRAELARIGRRHGPLHRAARDTDWGDPWPPGAVEAPD